MKCPNCAHVSETDSFQCAACGEVYDPAALETYRHLEFVAAWLKTNGGTMAAEARATLHAEAMRQLEAARAALGPPVVAEPTLVLAPELPLPAPPSEEQLRDVALAVALGNRLETWLKATVIEPAAAQELHAFIARHIAELRASLSGTGIRLPAVSDEDVIYYAVDKLPLPAVLLLRPHLESLLAPLLPPGAPLPISSPAPVASLADLARELALTNAVLVRLGQWAGASGLLGPTATRDLQAELMKRVSDLRAKIGNDITLPPVSDVDVVDFALATFPPRALETLRSYLERQRAQLARPIPSPASGLSPTDETPAPVAERVELKPIASIIAPTLMVPIVKTPALEPVAQPQPAPAPRPTLAPKPQPPAINWGQMWERAWNLVVSGALLRGLLYLGAFMIVASAVVLVVVYWSVFPWLVRLAFIAAVPLMFYSGGFFLRNQLKIPVAGGVFTGIGALLVAVDFVAVYQIGGLAGTVDINLYWLIASLVCLGVYIFTAWRVPSEFFAYLALLGGLSTTLALTGVLRLPLEWRLATVALAGVAMTVGAARFRHAAGHWVEMSRAVKYLPLILFPATGFLVLTLQLFVNGNQALGQSVTFLLMAIGYATLAGAFSTTIWAHAAVWSSVGGLGFALAAFNLLGAWYATVAALVAPLYLNASWVLETRQIRRGFVRAVDVAGLGLMLAAGAGGLLTLLWDWWPGVWALAFTALAIGAGALRWRQPLLVLVGGGLFILPVSLGLGRVSFDMYLWQWGAWLMAAWVGLALTYMSLAVLLRRADNYGLWLTALAHGLASLSLLGLWVNYGLSGRQWSNGPTLIALSGALVLYVASAILHDSGDYPALSRWVNWLGPRLSRAIFLWPIGALIPAITAIAWWGSVFQHEWLGAALASLALLYVGAGQLLRQRANPYRVPPHSLAYVLLVLGILAALNARWPLMVTLYVAVFTLTTLAFAYRRVIEVGLAALLFLWPFQLALDAWPLTPMAYTLAYALLASLGYLPLGLVLQRARGLYHWPLYVVGYAVSALAVIASLGGREGFFTRDVPWIGMAVPFIITALYGFSLYRFKWRPFAWAAALVAFPIAFGQALTLLHVRSDYDAVAWIGLGIVYMVVERGLKQVGRSRWLSLGRWPLGLGSVALAGLGLALAFDPMTQAFIGEPVGDYWPLVLTFALATAQTIGAARLYRSHWPMFLEPVLAFVSVTVTLIAYSQLTSPQFALVWVVLALAHLLVAVPLDKSPARYARGVYLGGYALLPLAVGWTLWPHLDRAMLVWTLGLSLVAVSGSAWLTHHNQHRTWDEVVHLLFGQSKSLAQVVVRGAFLWVVAWVFPLWCWILLVHLQVADGIYWLGFGGSALAWMGLAVWLRRFERTYAWPLYSAAQFYTIAALLISAPLTLIYFTGDYERLLAGPVLTLKAAGFISVQMVAVIFYAASARVFQRRLFAHLSAWLSIIPYTFVWVAFVALPSIRFAWVWLGWATLLLVVGFALDRAKVRYSHGPYLAGYALSLFALAWSAPNRLVNLYALGGVILIALASHALTHFGWHRAFDDFCARFWKDPVTMPARAVHMAFLFFAAYAFPIWLMQLLAYLNVELAWWGLALALIAPLYIVCGLAARRARADYTWPLYSAGYALTAIGALLAFENETLLIYVLALDTVVYAASAYIFRQAFWLYLSNALVPAVVLLTLHHTNTLTAPWVAGVVMTLAFVDWGLGQWFNRRKGAVSRRPSAISAYALPFYAPAYMLSTVALVVASPDKFLALRIYSAGVALYALSAWAFREALFLYPAAWLAAVPYYLLMTLTPLRPEWYGLGWLPLIVGYIAIGRFVFHRKAWGDALGALTQPAMPFYLLAYALSLSMLLLSRSSALILTLALGAGALVYFGSAALFRRAAWLYPALLVTHFALMAALAIYPTDQPVHYIALPFFGLTWGVAVVGYAFSRRHSLPPVDHPSPFVHSLLTPSWAQPFLLFAALDVPLWQTLALNGYDTGLTLASGFALLIGLLAMLWPDALLAHVALGFGVLAGGVGMRSVGVAWPEMMAVLGGAGFGLYLLGWLVERGMAYTKFLAVWPSPLTRVAVTLTTIAMLVALPFTVTHLTATAGALAFAGLLYLTLALRGRYYRLGYAAVALLQFAWALLLIRGQVTEPQWYALPAGLYLTGMGFLERRRGARKLFAVGLESLGLTVLLLTAFIQSLRAGTAGVPYFVLLIVEGLLVIGWGAWRRIKIPFFIGFVASVLNVVGQVAVLFAGGSTFIRWLIIGVAGLLIVGLAVYVERQRMRIIAKAQEWREALETWD